MTLVDDASDRAVATGPERPVGAGRPRRQTSPPGDDGSPAVVGVAELREESPARDDSTGGDSADVDGRGPTEPPRRGRRGGRPDPPPRWMRLALYGMMLVVAFFLGYACGKVWARIDKAVWVDEPLWGSGMA